MTRLEQLWQFYLDDPDDPFNHYAYALELAKADKGKAADHLQELILGNPDYLPAYYQAAVLGISLNRDARKIIEQGIEKAKVQHNRKAQNELQALLDDVD